MITKKLAASPSAPRQKRATELTCRSTVKHLKVSYCSLALYCEHSDMFIVLFTGQCILAFSASVNLLIVGNTKDTQTAKAVKCLNMFNHDSRPHDEMKPVNRGFEKMRFLFERFFTLLDEPVCSCYV